LGVHKKNVKRGEKTGNRTKPKIEKKKNQINEGGANIHKEKRLQLKGKKIKVK